MVHKNANLQVKNLYNSHPKPWFTILLADSKIWAMSIVNNIG